MENEAPIYAYYRNGEIGHYIVVTGVNIEQNLVYTNNPWGISGVQTFEEFQTGVVGRNGNSPFTLTRIYLN